MPFKEDFSKINKFFHFLLIEVLRIGNAVPIWLGLKLGLDIQV